MKFRACIVKFYKTHSDGTITLKRTVVIKLYDEDSHILSAVQPISIVRLAWPSVKPGSLQTYMTRFVRFLNYAYFGAETPVQEISEITPNTVLLYFQSISATSGREYVRLSENCVTQALFYLWKINICTGFKESDFIYNRTGSLYIKDVHNCFALPRQVPRQRLHDMDLTVVTLMFDIACRYTPRIVLGLYFQIFGGLRKSEVVSCRYSGLHFNPDSAENALFVDVYDVDLRPELKSAFIDTAKINRKQKIIYIRSMYTQFYEINKEQTAGNISDAIFLNANGKPMTEDSYYYYFTKLKKILIDTLKSSNNFDAQMYGIFLSNNNWATHIGRGIYSNLVAENADTVAQIARARGDHSLDSSLPYLCNTKKIEDQITSALESIYSSHRFAFTE